MEGSGEFFVEEVSEEWEDEDGGVGWCGAHFLWCFRDEEGEGCESVRIEFLFLVFGVDVGVRCT